MAECFASNGLKEINEVVDASFCPRMEGPSMVPGASQMIQTTHPVALGMASSWVRTQPKLLNTCEGEVIESRLCKVRCFAESRRSDIFVVACPTLLSVAGISTYRLLFQAIEERGD